MIRKIKAEDKEIYIKMAHDFTGCQQWIIRFRILIWKRHLKNV